MSSPAAEHPGIDTTIAPSTREAIAAAAQARLASARNGGPGLEAESQRAKEEAEHLLRCRRIVDLQIRRDNGYEKAFECLKTLDTLLSNILSHPTEEKYRSFKSENPRLHRSVLSISGGTDYLLQAGFGTRTVEFKQQWYLHPSILPPTSLADPDTGDTTATVSSWTTATNGAQKWRRLELARKVLLERLDESESRSTQKREQQRREAEVERNRAARALQEAQEDRERVALRAQRDKLARARREKEEPHRGGPGTSAATGAQGSSSRSGAVYHRQPPFDSRPNYQVNTATLVGGSARSERAGEQDGRREGGETPTGINRSDYANEVPFDEPSVRGSEAGTHDEDEQGGQPPPYGREEWGSGRRLGS